ncbi:ATP-grasp domain-containing protein [Fructilactobacillus frigidiflavus]|uniref:ATP-grasp domain-containing protein n=1 Tax=Fructilactobacillus frigidiflavus TaxID=3242688 RepID=UPI003756D226
MNTALLNPGATLGVIGDNLNGCQIVKEAKNLGLNVGVLTSLSESRIKQYADFVLVGNFKNHDILEEFAKRCDVVTYATDQVDVAAIQYMEQFTKIPQGTGLLEIVQDRALEHAFFDQLNVNSAPYMTVVGIDDLYQASESIGYPAVLKPILKTLGNYQELKIGTKNEIDLTKPMLGNGTFILESDIDYLHQFAVLATRDQAGKLVQFPAIEYHDAENETVVVVNDHFTGIKDAIEEMQRITAEIAKNIDYVGTFEINFGFDKNETLYVCGIHPTTTSLGFIFNLGMNVNQYRQHLRALSNLPIPEVKKYTDVILRSFIPEQLPTILAARASEPTWQLNFEYQCVLVPTDSVIETEASFKQYNL